MQNSVSTLSVEDKEFWDQERTSDFITKVLFLCHERLEKIKNSTYNCYSYIASKDEILSELDFIIMMGIYKYKYNSNYNFYTVMNSLCRLRIVDFYRAIANSREEIKLGIIKTSFDNKEQEEDSRRQSFKYMLSKNDKNLEDIDKKEEINKLNKVLSDLIDSTITDKKHKHIINSYYFKQIPIKDIAKEVGISDSRTSAIHSLCLKQLKEKIEKDAIDINAGFFS